MELPHEVKICKVKKVIWRKDQQHQRWWELLDSFVECEKAGVVFNVGGAVSDSGELHRLIRCCQVIIIAFKTISIKCGRIFIGMYVNEHASRYTEASCPYKAHNKN